MVSTKIIVTEDFGVQKISVSISQSSKKSVCSSYLSLLLKVLHFLREETGMFLN